MALITLCKTGLLLRKQTPTLSLACILSAEEAFYAVHPRQAISEAKRSNIGVQNLHLDEAIQLSTAPTTR
jgi:hypothetical protein